MLSNACNTPQNTILTMRQTLCTIAESQRRHVEWHKDHLRVLGDRIEFLTKQCELFAPPKQQASTSHFISSSTAQVMSARPATTDRVFATMSAVASSSKLLNRQELEALAATITPEEVCSVPLHILSQLLAVLAGSLSAGGVAGRTKSLLVVHEIACQHPRSVIPLAVAQGVEACVHDHRVLTRLKSLGVPLEPLLELHKLLVRPPR